MHVSIVPTCKPHQTYLNAGQKDSMFRQKFDSEPTWIPIQPATDFLNAKQLQKNLREFQNQVSHIIRRRNSKDKFQN